ncbi:hypothetical protein PGT21_032202 [Puccinia graminis f. sp. tritici]|uniref:Uncharacterized protein n=1 Tax=Puccinia graminis f. sp. tritici TaxID=56615 RepID=A0A5B0QK23_PUCGR|nr:hypothetical protein PGT21_032202 [Puccinia graminis f. sp. tritici]
MPQSWSVEHDNLDFETRSHLNPTQVLPDGRLALYNALVPAVKPAPCGKDGFWGLGLSVEVALLSQICIETPIDAIRTQVPSHMPVCRRAKRDLQSQWPRRISPSELTREKAS